MNFITVMRLAKRYHVVRESFFSFKNVELETEAFLTVGKEEEGIDGYALCIMHYVNDTDDPAVWSSDYFEALTVSPSKEEIEDLKEAVKWVYYYQYLLSVEFYQIFRWWRESRFNLKK